MKYFNAKTRHVTQSEKSKKPKPLYTSPHEGQLLQVNKMTNTAGMGICLLLQDKEAQQHQLEGILNYISNFFQREGFIEKKEEQGKCVYRKSYRKEIRIPEIERKFNTNIGYTVNVGYWIYKHSNRKSCIELTPGTFSISNIFPYNPEEKQMQVINKLSKELTTKFELQEVYKCLDQNYAIEE